MPCYTINTVAIKVKSMQLDILKKALESLGYYPILDGQTLTWGAESYNKATNELRVTSQGQVAKISKAYGKAGLKEVAASYSRLGWQLKPSKDLNKFTLEKISM